MDDQADERTGERADRPPVDRTSLIAGVIYIVLGVGFLADTADWVTIDIDARWIFPVLLIAIGAAGLASGLRRDRST